MFLCYECSLSNSNIKQLLAHYEFVHAYTNSSSYTCFQNSCLKTYPTKAGFVKHLNEGKHDQRSTLVNSQQDCPKKTYYVNDCTHKTVEETSHSTNYFRKIN